MKKHTHKEDAGFCIQDAYRESFQIIKKHSWMLIGQYAILIGFLIITSIISRGSSLLNLVFSTLYTFFAVHFSFAYAGGQEVSFEDVYAKLSFKKFAYLFLAILMTGLVMVLSLGGLWLVYWFATMHHYFLFGSFSVVLFIWILPVFVALTHVAFVKFIAVEEDITPIQALVKSSKITRRQRLHVFVLIVSGLLINFVGLVFLLVGLLFTLPLTMIAMVLVYKKITHTTNTEEAVETLPEEGIVVTEVIEVVEVVE